MSKKKYKGHPLFYKYTQEEIDLHDKKNWDYAGSGDPLGNFKRVAKIVDSLLNPIIPDNLKPAAIALIYATKQFDAAIDMMSNNRNPKVEKLGSRMMDVSVYAKLFRIIMEESKGTKKK